MPLEEAAVTMVTRSQSPAGISRDTGPGASRLRCMWTAASQGPTTYHTCSLQPQNRRSALLTAPYSNPTSLSL